MAVKRLAPAGQGNGRALIALAVPIMAAHLLQTSYQLVNIFWLGRLGAGAVAAVSMVLPVIFLLFAIAVGIAIAGSTLVAQSIGANDTALVNRTAAQAVAAAALAALAIAATGYSAVPALGVLLNIDASIAADALAYLRIAFLTVPPMFIFYVVQSVLRGVGEVRAPLYIVIAGVAVNAVMDPLLMFGWGPVPAFGVVGAAYATLIIQTVSALLGFGLLYRGRRGLAPRAVDFMPDRALLGRLLRRGVPASIEQAMQPLGMVVMTGIVAHFGPMAIAAYGMGSRVLTFVLVPAMSLAMAATTLVGHYTGSGNFQRAHAIVALAGSAAFGLLLCLGVLLFAGATGLTRMFFPHDGLLIEQGARMLAVMSLAFGFLGVQLVLAGALRGTGDTVGALLLALLYTWGLQLPLAWVLSRHTALGVDGLWFSYPVAAAAATAIAAAQFRHWRERNGGAARTLAHS